MPAKRESKGRTFHSPNTRTTAGPATMDAIAYLALIFPGSHRAKISGAKITAPRRPMDIKANCTEAAKKYLPQNAMKTLVDRLEK